MCDGAKNLQARFRLKSFESFVSMECFDDTAMSMSDQTISLISSDALETDEIFVMNEAFLIRNHARVSCLSRHTRKEKAHIIRVNLIYHTISLNSLMSWDPAKVDGSNWESGIFSYNTLNQSRLRHFFVLNRVNAIECWLKGFLMTHLNHDPEGQCISRAHDGWVFLCEHTSQLQNYSQCMNP